MSLGPRAADLLQMLVLRRPQVVAADELIRCAWPGEAVPTNTLQAQMSSLRRLLGPGVIDTVRGRGYRFIAATSDHGVAVPSGAPGRDDAAALVAAAPPAPASVPAAQPETLHFDGLKIHAASSEIEVSGQCHALRRPMLALLLALARQRGSAVSKSDLMEAAWPDAERSENHLQAQIVALRKLVGAHRLVSVPGQGYAFHAAVVAAPSTLRGASGSRLIGRDDVLAGLQLAMRSQPLVSLVGTGGVGKTSLARALLRESATQWPDGAIWVDLVPHDDPAAVPGAVARAVGMTIAPGAEAAEELATLLSPLQLLLVLDNTEHVLDAVAALANALRQRAPGVHLLTTGQRRLGVDDEQVVMLEPLALPAQDDLAAAQASPAVQMFVAQVRDTSPRFMLNAGNVGAVIEVCRRLDGLPLALELAAARVRLLGLEGVRSQLSARFSLLRRHGGGPARRHDTLRASLDWSHALLSPAEQVVYRRIGVFADGFTPVLAQAVCADAQLSPAAVLDALDALMERSLLVATGVDVARCELLESTRAHALEALEASGETALLRRRLALALRRLGDDALRQRDRGTLGDYEFANLMLPELRNFRDAVDAMRAAGDAAMAIALADARNAVLFAHGRAPEALDRLLALEPLVEALPPDREGQVLAARLWRRLGRCGVEGRLPATRSIELLLRAAASFEAVHEPRHQHECLWMAAESVLDTGDSARALQWLEQARRLEAADWHGVYAIRRLNVLGAVHTRAGHLTAAREVIARALDSAETLGLERYALILRCDLAKVELDAGNTQAAALAFGRVAQASQGRTADRANLADALFGLATCQAQLGLPAQALVCLQQAATLWVRTGVLLARGAGIAWLLQTLGQPEAAAQWLGAVDAYLSARVGPHREPRFQQTLDALAAAGTDTASEMAVGRSLPLATLLAGLGADPAAAPGRAPAPPAGRGVWVFVPIG